MQVERTVQIRIKESSEALIRTLEDSTTVYQDTLVVGFDCKTRNKIKLTNLLYRGYKNEHPRLYSDYIQSSIRRACETLKACAKKTHSVPIAKKLCVRGTRHTFKWHKHEEKILLNTVEGWQEFPCIIPKYVWERYPNFSVDNVIITYDKKKGCTLGLIHKFDVPDPKPLEECVNPVGVDRGIYYIGATSDGRLYGSGAIRYNRARIQHNISTCQSKGTRSARKRMAKMFGRARRYTENVLRVIVKQICAGHDVVFLEDLNIKKMIEQSETKKKRKLLSTVPMYLFEQILREYCELHGIRVGLVNPAYTSQTCSRCGCRSKEGRHTRGEFVCPECGLYIHADINAGKNICQWGNPLARANCQTSECSGNSREFSRTSPHA